MPEVVIYRNQTIDLQSKSVDWFLYDRDLRHESVKLVVTQLVIILGIHIRLWKSRCMSIVCPVGSFLELEILIEVTSFSTIVLGFLRIEYEILGNSLNSSVEAASVLEDVGVANGSIQVQNGSNAVKIRVPLIDDSIPEIDEGFTVHLKTVKLLSSSNSSTLQPRIDKNNNKVFVVIQANDGTNGELSFDSKSIE